MVFTGGFLQCIVPPSQYQRVRYVRELENDALRYMNVDNDGVLTLSVCNHHSFFFLQEIEHFLSNRYQK